MARNSIRHGADFLFHFGGIHHHDGVPWAAVQEAAVGALAEALLAADAQNGINLDAPERRIVLIRHPEHAVFHRAVLHASGRSRAARAALRNNRQFFRLFLARRDDSLRARLLLQLVGHHSRGFDSIGCISHFQRLYLPCQAFVSEVFPPVPCLLQCPCIRLVSACTPCSPNLSTNISCLRFSPDLPCASSSSGTSLSIRAIPPTTKSLGATGCTTEFTASTPRGSFFRRMPARPATWHFSARLIFWLVPPGKQPCPRTVPSFLPRAFC